MKTLLLTAGLAVALTGAASAQTAHYVLDSSYVYANGGQGGYSAELRVETRVAQDGTRRHLVYNENALFADTMFGTALLLGDDDPAIELVSTPDRVRTSLAGDFAEDDRPANEAAAAGLADAVGRCEGEGVVHAFELTYEGAPERIGLSFDFTPLAGGLCGYVWRSEVVPATLATGSAANLTFTGYGVLRQSDKDVLYSSVAFAGAARNGPMNGVRVLLQHEPDDIEAAARSAATWSAALDIPSVNRFQPGDLDIDTPAGVAQALDAASATALANYIDMVAISYAKERTNALPAIAVAYFADQLVASVVSLGGSGLQLLGESIGDRAAFGISGHNLAAAGKAAAGYNGLSGWAVTESTRLGASLLGYDGDRAAAAAGLGFSTVNLANPARLSLKSIQWLGRAHYDGGPLVRGAIGQLARLEQGLRPLDRVLSGHGAFRYGFDMPDTVINILGVGPGDDAFVGPRQRASNIVSTGPTTGGALNRLRYGPDPAPWVAPPAAPVALTTPVSPFVGQARGDFSQSTAGFADVTIAGILAFRLFDFGSQDGDAVSLSVTNEGRLLLGFSTVLTNAGANYSVPGAREGSLVIMRLTAENEGSISPNTGAISITSLVLDGNPNQQYSLLTGQSGVFRVFIAGRRAR